MASYVAEGSSVKSSEEEAWVDGAEGSESEETESSSIESDVPSSTPRKARKRARTLASWKKKHGNIIETVGRSISQILPRICYVWDCRWLVGQHYTCIGKKVIRDHY